MKSQTMWMTTPHAAAFTVDFDRFLMPPFEG